MARAGRDQCPLGLSGIHIHTDHPAQATVHPVCLSRPGAKERKPRQQGPRATVATLTAGIPQSPKENTPGPSTSQFGFCFYFFLSFEWQFLQVQNGKLYPEIFTIFFAQLKESGDKSLVSVESVTLFGLTHTCLTAQVISTGSWAGR